MLSSPRQLCALQSPLNAGTDLYPAVGAAIAGRANDKGADYRSRSNSCFSRLVSGDFRSATSKELLGFKSSCLGELNAEGVLDDAKMSEVGPEINLCAGQGNASNVAWRARVTLGDSRQEGGAQHLGTAKPLCSICSFRLSTRIPGDCTIKVDYTLSLFPPTSLRTGNSERQPYNREQ